MDSNAIATIIGVGVQTVSTFLQTYVTFRKSNVEKYFELLIKADKDLSAIGSNDRLLKNFFLIIDYVSKETTEEKIHNWKNLTIKLASKFEDIDFVENYTAMLNSLTPFDLTVLFAIYSNDFNSKYINKNIVEYFNKRNVSEFQVFHSVKRLASHNLISEESDGMTLLTNGETFGQKFLYQKNEFGQEFLKIINN